VISSSQNILFTFALLLYSSAAYSFGVLITNVLFPINEYYGVLILAELREEKSLVIAND
jgi:hypothetical protein